MTVVNENLFRIEPRNNITPDQDSHLNEKEESRRRASDMRRSADGF